MVHFKHKRWYSQKKIYLHFSPTAERLHPTAVTTPATLGLWITASNTGDIGIGIMIMDTGDIGIGIWIIIGILHIVSVFFAGDKFTGEWVEI